MAGYNKIQQFVEDLAHGAHDFSADTLQVALTNNANPPVATNTVLANLTQIAYTNLSTQVITGSASGHTTGTYTLTLTDLTLTASGAVAAFQYIVIFNQSMTAPDPEDGLICWFSYGSDLTLASGESLTIDFGNDGGSTGDLLTLV